MALCSVDKCGGEVKALGLCLMHYTRQKRHGSVENPRQRGTCSVAGCGAPHKAHGFCKAHYAKSWRESQPADIARERWRVKNLRRYYGITVEQYDAMFAAQHGRCAICETHQRDMNYALAVDHDHATGKVRALLCHKCNLGIGYMREDRTLLLRAIRYLEESSSRPQMVGVPHTGGSDQRGSTSALPLYEWVN